MGYVLTSNMLAFGDYESAHPDVAGLLAYRHRVSWVELSGCNFATDVQD